MVAAVTGPAHAVAQRWLAGQLPGPLASFADDLIDAAVAGPSASAPSRRRRPVRPAVASRIRLQLLAEDGTILAEGELAELDAVKATTKRRAGTSVTSRSSS